jgi:hypothetical protein
MFEKEIRIDDHAAFAQYGGKHRIIETMPETPSGFRNTTKTVADCVELCRTVDNLR